MMLISQKKNEEIVKSYQEYKEREKQLLLKESRQEKARPLTNAGTFKEGGAGRTILPGVNPAN